MKAPALLLVLSSLLLLSGCQARITDATVERENRGIILIASPFGFGTDGHVDITVKNFQYWPASQQDKVDLSQMGFFITTSEAEAQLEIDLSHVECALDADNIVKLLTFDRVQDDVLAGKQEGTVIEGEEGSLAALIDNYQGGEYSLFFVNCQTPAVVSFDVRVSLYNVRSDQKDYLSVGEDTLPTMYMVLFVLFCLAAALWSAVVYRARANAHHIHSLMIVLVAFKALTLLSQAGMYHLIRIHGHPEGWNIAFYVFTFMRGILFFTVVVLVGTGWSYMKPLLADKEKRILMVVIPLQVMAEVAIIILDENTPASRSWFTWRDILHLVDIICCCAILFPIVWSIKHLREASQTDGKAARSLVKLTLFRQFYVMVVSYIYFTRIVVYLLKSTMPYKYVWISDAAGELATLAFYVMTGLKFRPHEANPYFLVNDNDIDPQELARYV